MSISQAASLILKVTVIANDGEIFILKMPSVRIVDLAKSMLNICGKRFLNGKNLPPVKISEARERERLQELLISNEESLYCQDVGEMYKISNKISKKQISLEQISSETATKISGKELDKIISEVLDEYSL